MAYRFSWIAGAAAIFLALLRMSRLLRPVETGPPWQLALLAGALLGARSGLDGLPPQWVAEVERSNELRQLALRI